MNWTDKTILITGGTGSFGTAFSEYLLTQSAKKVIVFSRDWLKQSALRDKLGNPPNFRWFIGDVRDKDRLIRALKNVDIVVHAAAIKDLPSCEYNPDEAMKTNVQGTQNVIDACLERKVGKCIFISTDKAVNPINTYGTSKALAEKLWINANKYAANDDVRFSVCRYGNVYGSNGSVVPVWKKMIADGADELPVTDERMTRYWWSLDEAVQFVVEALDKMLGGETFIPDLPSVRIVDVATAFGMPYKVVGIREGEKIHETMGKYRAGELITSGNNDRFLTVDEIKKTIEAN